MNYTVGIIGLGQIGMTYDTDFQSTTDYLSHAKSFYHHPSFHLEFLLDVDEIAREKAKNYFPAVAVYGNLQEIKTYPEVLVLAANQENNVNIYKTLRSNSEIKLFVVEKPFWETKLFQTIPFQLNQDQKIFVNYFRKALPYYQFLKEEIKNNLYGKAIHGGIYYSKGLRNNGSHLLDLINYLFEPEQVIVQNVFNQKNDFKTEDLSYSFILKLKTKQGEFPVVFNALDERKYSLIEVDLFFEKKRIRCTDFGGKLEEHDLLEDPLFPGYTNLNSTAQIQDASLNKYGIFTCDLVHEILSGTKENPSSIQNEIAIFDLVKKIKDFE